MPVPTELAAGKVLADIVLQRQATGFGFNIVGGLDSEHIVGDNGVFVSKIKKEGSAYQDGRLQEGDRIVSVDGKNLEGLTHTEVVEIFKRSKNIIKLTIEPDGERKALELNTSLGVDDSQSQLESTPFQSFANNNSPPGPDSFTTPYFTPESGPTNFHVESSVDRSVSGSQTPSIASLQLTDDDVPPTPLKDKKKDKNRSFWNGFYGLVGTAAICVGGYMFYRWYSKK